jgi:hypothetical protein
MHLKKNAHNKCRNIINPLLNLKTNQIVSAAYYFQKKVLQFCRFLCQFYLIEANLVYIYLKFAIFGTI